MSSLEILVISLPGAEARRRLIRAQLDLPGVPAVRVLDAVDGRGMTEAQVAAAYDDRLASRRASGTLGRGEIGCACSHLLAYRHMLDRGIPVAVVLEDDAIVSHQFLAVLQRLLPLIDSRRSQAVLLSHVWRYSDWGARKVDKIHRLCRPYEAYGCHGYVITAAGAAAMVSAFPRVRTVADDWGYFARTGVLDVKAIVPYVVGTSLFAGHSQIGGSRWTSEPPGRLYQWARKYLWRKFLFQVFVKPALRLRKQESTW